MRKKRVVWDWVVLGAIVGLFLCAASRDLTLPGLSYDEAYDASYGMELALGLPRTETDWAISVGGKAWPLRIAHPYDFSAFAMYWSGVFFSLFGVSVSTLRWAALLLASCLIIAFYAFSRSLLPSRVGLAACALLAAHPSFLILSRVVFFGNEIIVTFFGALALGLASIWHRSRASWALYAAVFVLGFSANVATKSLAFLVALPALFLLWIPRSQWPSVRTSLVAGACGLVGAANPIAFCIRDRTVIRSLLDSLAGPTPGGVDNWALLQNIATRWGQLCAQLDGSIPFANAGQAQIRAPLVLGAFVAAFLALSIRAVRMKNGGARRLLGFLLSLPVVLFLETCFTPMGHNPDHVLVTVPFVLLVVAEGLELLASWRPSGLRRPWAPVAAAGILGALLVSECRIDAAYFTALERTGGVAMWSSALYDAEHYFEERGIHEVYCLSWGIAKNLYVASAGRVAPSELHSFRGSPRPPLLERFKEAVGRPDGRFLVFADDVPNLSQRTGSVDAFRQTVSAAGKAMVLEREFCDKTGRKVLLLYRLGTPPSHGT